MLKHLTLEEMVALLLPWVGKTKRRDTFLSIKEIAPLHPLVVEAYEGVLAVRPVDTTRSPALRKLDEKAALIDDRHDNLARAAYHDLLAERAHSLAAEPPDTDRAALSDKALAQLLPDGLAVLNTSYLAESGNTARIAKLLEDEPWMGTFLKSIPVRGKKTLTDTLAEWIAAGRQLEDVEHEREEHLAKQAVPATKANIQAARSQWFRVVTTILNNLDLSKAPPEAIESIRGPVLRASDRAAKRYATGNVDTPILEPDAEAGDPTDEAPAEKKPAAEKKPVG